LGFATNESNTNDVMTWINAYDTYKNWIDNIVMHSYKDDNSFYDIWVDYYYIMNFINMNTLYSVSDESDAILGLSTGSLQNDHNADDNVTHYKVSHHFTNAPGSEKTNYFYDSLEFINNSGDVNILNGYKRYLHFYDIARRESYRKIVPKHDIIYIDPLITTGSGATKNVMKGRPGENFYKDMVKHKWQGIQYSKAGKNNVHD
jgi:hypothetical protein